MELTAIGERAVALFRQGRTAEALAALDGFLATHPAELAILILKARMLQAARRPDEALASFDRALGVGPDAELWNERGALLNDMGRNLEAVESYDRALAARPNFAEAFYNRGNALRDLKREEDALQSFERAIELKPDFLQALNNRGSALQALGRNREAVECFDRLLAVHAVTAEPWNNRGIALAALGRHDEALVSYDRALALDANNARAWDNRGTLLRQMGRGAEALASHDRALAIAPSLADAWFNRGNVLREQRRLDEALNSYDRALALAPGNARAWSNRGIVLRDMKRIPEALASYGKALESDPDFVEALYSRGIAHWVENHDYEAARADLERAVALDPDFPYALGGLILVKQYGADWRDFDGDVARLTQAVRAGKPVTEPFVYQALSGAPADLMACSILHAKHRYPAQTPMAGRERRPGKIRIGYVSGEFREQATAYLMAGVYDCHDKEKFEILAFDNGFDDGSPIRKRLEGAFDRMIDISRLSDHDAARTVHAAGVDILINLNGYFGDHRMGVFAHRPAPIQVNYLGFPATLGAPYMDYILADRIVIPESEREFYTEQVAYLPGSYQANDSRRAMAKDIPSRADCGLPDNGFVFCNFNAAYKLVPATFAGWMRILSQVPGSVLWLLEGEPQFSQNLRREAGRHGVEEGRLVFAPVMGLAPHLARLARADLFLDSLPYNAHTTASDSLWAGVPLLTCRGTAFPGRVAASLNAAIGLPELIAETPADLESLAVGLARDPLLLQSVRKKLTANRAMAPLFDTLAFTRNLEAAYEKMHRAWQSGEPARGFAV